jgi:hypothetical protein
MFIGPFAGRELDYKERNIGSMLETLKCCYLSARRFHTIDVDDFHLFSSDELLLSVIFTIFQYLTIPVNGQLTQLWFDFCCQLLHLIYFIE